MSSTKVLADPINSLGAPHPQMTTSVHILGTNHNHETANYVAVIQPAATYRSLCTCYPSGYSDGQFSAYS
jgi:hypothetical protein